MLNPLLTYLRSTVVIPLILVYPVKLLLILLTLCFVCVHLNGQLLVPVAFL